MAEKTTRMQDQNLTMPGKNWRPLDAEERHPPCFSAILVPHRSLSPRGFVIFMSALGAISFIAGMAFLMIGAWPVMGFFGLDVLVIYFAFKLNYRAGRLFETVELHHDNLTIRRVHPNGREENFDFNPYWVRVHLSEQDDGSNSLSVYLHNRVVSIGAFLTDDERRDFAGALKAALREARS